MFCLKGERGRAPRSFPAGLCVGWRRGAETLSFGGGEREKKKKKVDYSTLYREERGCVASFVSRERDGQPAGMPQCRQTKGRACGGVGARLPGVSGPGRRRERGCWGASGNGGVLGQGGREGSRVLTGIPENVLLMFLFKIGVVEAFCYRGAVVGSRQRGAVVRRSLGAVKHTLFQ